MIPRIAGIAFLMAFALLVVPRQSAALDADINRRTLNGIKSLLVVVEEVTPDAKEIGLTPEILEKDVKAKLKEAGIRVVSQEEWLKLPGSPYLYLQTSVVKVDRAGNYAFTVAASVLQDVYLKRDPAIDLAEATTWSVGSHGHTDRRNRGFVRQAVADMVDLFVAAYREANGAAAGPDTS